LRLSIEKLIYGGDGLARLPANEHGRGKAVFVPFVLPGEEVEAALTEERPGFARANVERMLQPSAARIEARCPYFGSCGGCHYQHTDYQHQLEIKAAILNENLRRIAKIELDQELQQVHASPPWNYRNRARLKVQHSPEFAIGYYKFNSHELLPIERCPISSPLINRAIVELYARRREGKIGECVQELELFADSKDSALLVSAFCPRDASAPAVGESIEALRQALPAAVGVVGFESRPGRTPLQENSALEKISASGEEQLTYEAEGARYRVSAGSFFQVNRHLLGHLVELATGGLSGELALDLYAGVGLFSVALARSFAQVIAVEPSQTAHADLRHNCSANVKAVRSTTEQYLEKAAGKVRADIVVVDPPRSGLGMRVARSVGELGARQIVYVSCDPATLARDLASLLAAGYRIQKAHLVDLFPQTYHLESVFHLGRSS